MNKMVLLDSLCKECQYKYRSSELRDEDNSKFIHISNFCEKCQRMFSQSQLRDKKPSEVNKMYVITANVRGTRDTITKPASLAETRRRLKAFQKDFKMAIPKYKWAKDMRIVKV